MNESRSLLCAVRGAGDDDEEDPLFTIEFTHPDRWTNWPDRLGADHAYYRVGLYGEAGPDGGSIAFRCGRGVGGSGFPVVAASLELHRNGSAYAGPPGRDRTRAFMTILHATTRAMAENLNCGTEATLPPHLPHPSPPSDYRRPPYLRGPGSEQPAK
ncbi:hypothetical protein [Streptomyces huiliensis]|uniref:hypothetical protein n=1 Tax=Streptomyces huiliensis TaxID=2876027 RepID=UPI001CBC80E4|nr:hypothetical protein [Streptomyces huiliensis]MBZ4320323.1 hypothetical protein [Streptomyces huiliensis]